MTTKELQQWCTDNILNKKGKINGNKLRKDYSFYLENIEIFNEIKTLIPLDIPIGYRIMCLLNNIFEYPKCYCGVILKTINKDTSTFPRYCSHKCAMGSEQRIERLKVAVKNQTKKQKDEINIKTKATKLEKYGDENYVNPDKCTQTKRNDIDENGLDCCQRIAIKTKATKLEKYGDENYNNCTKMIETNLNKTQEVKDYEYNKRRESAFSNIDENGLNAYERGARAGYISAINNIDENGLNAYERGAIKTVTNRSIIGNDGLNSYERGGIKTVQTCRDKYICFK